MTDHEIALPPLPHRALRPGAGDDAMQAYARAAVLLDRQQRAAPRAEPVAWLYQHVETGRTRIVMPDQVFTNAPGQWLMVGPLYQHPPAPSAEPVGEIVGTEKRGFALMTLVCWEPGFNRCAVGTKLYTTPPDHLAVMRQALDALEERYIGALRDNAVDALRAALEPKQC
jgi:hypothetical protein